MQQIVSITSQGQITLPASMRRAISIDKYQKAVVRREGNSIVIEPITDFLQFGGKLKKKAKKNLKIEKIIELEEKKIAKMVK